MRKAEILGYHVNLADDPRDGIYIARVPELENRHMHGTTPEEALAHTQEAVSLWLETAKAKKIALPTSCRLDGCSQDHKPTCKWAGFDIDLAKKAS